MSIRFIRAGLGLALAGAAACSDAPTASTVDTTGATTNTRVSCTTPLSLTVGQVVPALPGTGFCLTAGSSTAEYALVSFNGASATDATFDVVSAGASAPSLSPNLIATGGASLDVVSIGAALSLSSAAPYPRSTSFELGLRQRERTLVPKMSGARIWASKRATTHASLDAIPQSVVVGQYMTLNSNSNDACSAPKYRAGRVVAITNRAIVVADTLNPSGGYTDTEYASLGTSFDTLVDPLDRSAFGDPSDIDGNGHIILFFTKAVNDLTPTSSSSYIGGFFDARDLFPAQGTADFDACAASNVGEMFYIMVPDPARGGAFSKANVASEVLGTLAHEYQHLINASRRMYVNTAATDFEETWLDEGLAHTAEELLFFRLSGLQPRQNLSPTAIRSSSAALSAFNNYETGNFGRYSDYLSKPSAYSPYADNDSLATRGATWAFLRYAADHLGTTDGDVWYRLVNSSTTGIANLQNVFGANVLNEIRDWGTSVLTDDLTNVATAYQQPSWNFRSMFAALTNTSVFPITTVSLATGAHTVNLVRGANAYLRFDLAAGAAATVQWNTAPPTVQFALVRVQ